MDNSHRQKIMSSIDRLAEDTKNFDIILNKLKQKGVFNDYMESEILQEAAGRKRLKFFYQYITTRGPNAFRKLCETLTETNNGELASHLASDSSCRVCLNGDASNNICLDEEFPSNQEKWTVAVGSSNEIFDWDQQRVYKMRSKPKGLVLIININIFVNNSCDVREGSEHDVRRLKCIFQQLGYEVFIHENLTADQIIEQVQLFARRKEHWDCDSSIVFVMSHGKDTDYTEMTQTVNIVGYDMKRVNSQLIINELMALKCQALSGKPKLFFFQACRGDNFNYPVQQTNNRGQQTDYMNIQMDNENMNRSIRNDSDILVGYSTSPGNVSLRDPQEGSWYIQTLCRVLAKHAWNKDIVTMLEYVQQERDRQLRPETVERTMRGFSRKFYFQPGIYDETNYL